MARWRRLVRRAQVRVPQLPSTVLRRRKNSSASNPRPSFRGWWAGGRVGRIVSPENPRPLTLDPRPSTLARPATLSLPGLVVVIIEFVWPLPSPGNKTYPSPSPVTPIVGQSLSRMVPSPARGNSQESLSKAKRWAKRSLIESIYLLRDAISLVGPLQWPRGCEGGRWARCSWRAILPAGLLVATGQR